MMISIKKLMSTSLLLATLFFTSCTPACVDALADLIITAASLTSPTNSFTTGNFYPFAATIKNIIQCIAADNSQTNLSVGYSSSYSTNPNAYAPVTSANNGTGAISGNASVQMNRQISFNRPGYYLLNVTADNYNNVTEESETNNNYNEPSASIRSASANVEPTIKGIVIEVKQGTHVWKEGEPMAEIK